MPDLGEWRLGNSLSMTLSFQSVSKQTPNEARVAELKRKREAINAVSPSFCLAKWLQSTVYLHNGMTHSCHHPTPHKIPLGEIENNPSALHNTSFKRTIRHEMMKGDFPKECQYCWNIENLSKEHFSDRHYKSGDPWAFPRLEEVLKDPTSNIDPSYVEVAFESTCNFKCAYCTPDISTKWMDEIKRFGPYPTSSPTGDLSWIEKSGRMPIPRREENPYVKAFWQWWPQLVNSLHTFRITGGEPLLTKNTWKVMDYFKENPQPNLNLAINTNLGVSDELIDRLIADFNELHGNIKSFEIFTSCEAKGSQAEYIRFGLNYKAFLENVEKFLENTPSDSRINFMITFNALSAPSFSGFLEDIWRLREKYNETDAMNRLPIMINYLRWPEFLSMQILPATLKKQWSEEMLQTVKKYSRNQRPGKPGRLYLEEIDQVERLCQFMQEEPKEMGRLRKDFSIFFREYDRRRSTNFAEVFPELKEFIEHCDQL